MTTRASLPSDGSDDVSACLSDREAWARLEQAAVEARIRELTDRGLGETFVAMLSGQSIETVRRAIGSRP
jgi:hypothetical protein